MINNSMSDDMFSKAIACASHMILSRHIVISERHEAFRMAGAVLAESTGRHNQQTLEYASGKSSDIKASISKLSQDHELCSLLSFIVDENAKDKKDPSSWIEHARQWKIYRDKSGRVINDVAIFVAKYIKCNFKG